jgi:hypothetical protein
MMWMYYTVDGHTASFFISADQGLITNKGYLLDLKS